MSSGSTTRVTPQTAAPQDSGLPYLALSVFLQTLLYGVFLTLFPISVHVMRKKGLRTRSRKIQLILNTYTFIIATISLIIVFGGLEELIVGKDWSLGSLGFASPLFSALSLANYVLTDGIVIWRAWVLCYKDFRKTIIAAGVFLVLTGASVGTTIVLRITAMIIKGPIDIPDREPAQITRAIDIAQVANLVFSLISNIIATTAISLKFWRIRKLQQILTSKNVRNRPASDSNAMYVIVESGLLYCISGTIVLVGTVIRLPQGTLGDVYSPVHVQLAAIYPTIVLLIVNLQKSIEESATSQTQLTTPSQMISVSNTESQSNVSMRTDSSRTALSPKGMSTPVRPPRPPFSVDSYGYDMDNGSRRPSLAGTETGSLSNVGLVSERKREDSNYL